MRVVGLTGSIGMGKSTTAAMFAAAGDPVHDADAAVHRLYAKGGAAVQPVGAAFEDVVVDGAVDRAALSKRVVGDAEALARLEAIVHPLVREEEAAFLEAARATRARLAILDIPLLFESGAAGRVDAVLVVSASAAVQRERVLARPGMSEQTFEAILGKQMPDEAKRAGAHYVIDTSHGLVHAAAQVKAVRRALLALA